MKKYLSLLLTPCLLAAFCSCGVPAQPETLPMETVKRIEVPGFDYIAYSQIDGTDAGSINTEEHLRYCAALPFTTLKADVQPTADGGLILCHDKGFTLNEEKRIVSYNKETALPIHTLTTEFCLSLEHHKTYEGKHCKVTDFETFIRICKESGKRAFITVRDEYIDEVIAAALPILQEYGWVENSMINSFTLSTLEAFRKACPEIGLSYVLQKNNLVTRMDVDAALRLGNCAVTSFHFNAADSETGWGLMEASADALAYAKEKGVTLYQAQVCQGVDLQRLMSYGYDGAQLRFVPDFQ